MLAARAILPQFMTSVSDCFSQHFNIFQIKRLCFFLKNQFGRIIYGFFLRHLFMLMVPLYLLLLQLTLKSVCVTLVGSELSVQLRLYVKPIETIPLSSHAFLFRFLRTALFLPRYPECHIAYALVREGRWHRGFRISETAKQVSRWQVRKGIERYGPVS